MYQVLNHCSESIKSSTNTRFRLWSISLRQAQLVLNAVSPDFSIDFSECPDVLTWWWGESGRYSSNSLNRTLTEGWKVMFSFRDIWRAKVPPSVRNFGYFLLKDKLLTREVLNKWGVQCELNCAQCDGGSVETLLHLIFNRPFVRQVWSYV